MDQMCTDLEGWCQEVGCLSKAVLLKPTCIILDRATPSFSHMYAMLKGRPYRLSCRLRTVSDRLRPPFTYLHARPTMSVHLSSHHLGSTTEISRPCTG